MINPKLFDVVERCWCIDDQFDIVGCLLFVLGRIDNQSNVVVGRC
jgi:hypothetical protein